ncbi:MAG: hypothetical protein WA667_03190 [Candidatus Nitrosopolaris sp.]
MPDIISWDKAIDKKVKSSDNKDLGKIQSITKEYIQTKEGSINKNYYYVPIYYIKGYDGDHVWVSLTKDDVKSRFESENAPSASEFETPDYVERRTLITQQYSDFDSNIPSYTASAVVPSASSLGTTSTSQSTPAQQGSSPSSVAMPWDKIMDKRVKSSDNKDLGKVQSISANYIEVKEGSVHKKRYYIPKYYIHAYDGEHLLTSLTKDEIKDRYERDSPPSESEFQAQEYEEQKRKVDSTYPQFLHGIPWMAQEPGVTLQSQPSAGEDLNIPWEEVIHKRVKTTDNVDIGDIDMVGNEFIVVREGVANVRLYYIPKTYINNYDGSSLYVAVPSGLVSAKFERETEPTPEEIRMLGEEKPKKRG